MTLYIKLGCVLVQRNDNKIIINAKYDSKSVS